MKKKIALAAGIVASIVLSGCATPVAERVVVCKSSDRTATRTGPALIGKDYGMEMSPIPLDSVQFTDAGLWERVAVQFLSASRTSTNGVEVTARFINCGDATLQILVRTSFMDERQAPTETTSAWQKVFIPPRATAIYTEKSLPNPRISHYLVEIAK